MKIIGGFPAMEMQRIYEQLSRRFFKNKFSHLQLVFLIFYREKNVNLQEEHPCMVNIKLLIQCMCRERA